MSLHDPHFLEQLRQGFKRYLNPFMLTLFRLGLATWFNLWPNVTGRVMIITHVGRKTGRRRRTPVNYAVVDGEVYCLAGFGSVSDWYRNIKAHPEVEVWLPDGWWTGVAEEIAGDDARWLPLMREVIMGSGLVAPMFGIRPKTMTDEELRAATGGYCLLRIRRIEARTGPGGPGDLAWVWPLATFLLLPLVFLGQRKRTRMNTDRHG